MLDEHIAYTCCYAAAVNACIDLMGNINSPPSLCPDRQCFLFHHRLYTPVLLNLSTLTIRVC